MPTLCKTSLRRRRIWRNCAIRILLSCIMPLWRRSSSLWSWSMLGVASSLDTLARKENFLRLSLDKSLCKWSAPFCTATSGESSIETWSWRMCCLETRRMTTVSRTYLSRWSISGLLASAIMVNRRRAMAPALSHTCLQSAWWATSLSLFPRLMCGPSVLCSSRWCTGSFPSTWMSKTSQTRESEMKNWQRW